MIIVGPNWDATITVILSSGISAAACKLLIQKSLKDLEKAICEVARIKEELAAIAVKLDVVSKYHEMVHQHDRKISALEVSLRNGAAAGHTR